MDAQKVYSDALGLIRDHRDLLAFDLECLRLLIRLIAKVWPLAENRVEYWRMLLLLGA